MKRLSIPFVLNRPTNPDHGDWCQVFYDSYIDVYLEALYGRPGLCLKVVMEGGERWGKSGHPLQQCIELQNVHAWYGLAPRVYHLVEIFHQGEWRPTMITDFVEGELTQIGNLELAKVVAAECFMNRMLQGGETPTNWVGGKFVDFQYFTYKDRGQYIKSLIAAARRGKDKPYQSIPGWAIEGGRDTEYRIEKMGLGSILFENKTVLDIGCNTGTFCRYAVQRGATRVTGSDPKYAKLAYEISNLLGYWSIDYEEATPYRVYDIVFALAVGRHIGGYGRWISNMCREVLFWEGHKDENPEKYRSDLERDFAEVDFLGFTEDAYKRPLFRCRNWPWVSEGAFAG